MQDSQSHTSEQLWQSSFAKAWPWMQVNTPEILDIPDIHVRGCSMPCLTMVSLAAVKFQPKGTKPSCMRCTFLAAERNNEKRKAVTSCDSMWLDDFLKAENNEKGRQTRTSLFGSISEIHRYPILQKKQTKKHASHVDWWFCHHQSLLSHFCPAGLSASAFFASSRPRERSTPSTRFAWIFSSLRLSYPSFLQKIIKKHAFSTIDRTGNCTFKLTKKFEKCIPP